MKSISPSGMRTTPKPTPASARARTTSTISFAIWESVSERRLTSSPMKARVGRVFSATSRVRCEASRPISRMKW